MAQVKFEDLLGTGAHFGHVTRKWDPNFKPYILLEKNGVHIINLESTIESIEKACGFVKDIVSKNGEILFVGTKKQAQDIVQQEADRCSMFYIVERWLGGTLTNFSTIKKSIKRLKMLEKEGSNLYENMTKKETQMLNREKVRLIWDAYKFSLPIIGKIIRSSNSARFSNTLSILTKSGIPLVDAMKIASEVVANKALQTDLRTATQDVVEGKSLRESLENISHFPPMMMHMIGSGEQSGELDQMLARVAEYQQAEVERLVSTLVKLFEPSMMIIMGGTVLFIVMAVLLPILSMNQIV